MANPFEEEEINFDQLLGDAAKDQAEFEEDRDDDSDEDPDDGAMGDSMSYSKTSPLEEKDKGGNYENEMWNMVIEKHGRKEFEATYEIIKKYNHDRFSETAQKQI